MGVKLNMGLSKLKHHFQIVTLLSDLNIPILVYTIAQKVIRMFCFNSLK